MSPQRLGEQVRRCLSAPPPTALPRGDNAVAGFRDPPEPATPIDAAVLIALLARRRPSILLTQRSARLSRHAGQICFPGGRSDPGDADATATALREAFEETGLSPGHVEPLGALPRYRTVTGFCITPVVGLVAEPPTRFRPSPAEVDEVFEVPLAFVLDRSNYQRHSRPLAGARRRSYYALPYREHANAATRYIWGATAAMLVSLALTLAPLQTAGGR